MAKSAFWDKYEHIFLTIWISGVTSTCMNVDTLPQTEGMACQPFESINITVIGLEFCSLACIQNQRCEAIIYDKTSGVCMLMNEPCFLLKPRFNHIYRTFKYDCTKWVPPNGSYGAYWYIQSRTKRSYVSRKAHQGNILVGKKTHALFSIDPVNNDMVTSSDYELLLVEPRCIVSWVQYDIMSGKPLPKEALIGGILTSTNTPLYVARLDVYSKKIGGYYNPRSGKAWAHYSGVRSNTLFEVMVVNL